jgi:hypothetical protein
MSKWEEWVTEEMLRRPVDIGSSLSPNTDWHHAIITKAMARGLPYAEHAKINMPWNLLVVDHEAHLWTHVPEGIEAAEILYRIYGRGAVRLWYDWINFRQRPFILP